MRLVHSMSDVGHVAGLRVPLAESPAGGVPGAADRPGRMGGERVVVAGECQCCGALVPAARRLTSCLLCRRPVIRRLHNEHGRSGSSRRGRETQEVASPMPDAAYRFAVDLLDRAWLNHGAVQTVPARCRCGEDLDGRMLVARQLGEDGEPFDTIVEDTGAGDDPTVFGCCDRCGRALVADALLERPVIRDRHRRCELALAEAV